MQSAEKMEMSMIKMSLPDGSVREYQAPVTGMEIAESIGSGLAKAALLIRVDGTLMDLSRELTADARIEIITSKDQDGIELLRHDAAPRPHRPVEVGDRSRGRCSCRFHP